MSNKKISHKKGLLIIEKEIGGLEGEDCFENNIILIHMNKNLYENVLRRILQESVTDITYHFTTFDALESILTTNKFMTNAAFATPFEAKKNKGKLFYFSMARSTTSSYWGATSSPVTLVLDGRKLSQSYKAASIDFWYTSALVSSERLRQNRERSEQEDRIFTDKPYIGPASKYIQEIHILQYLGSKLDKDEVKRLKNIESLATSLGLPLYFYSSSKDYRLLKKNKKVKSVDDLLVQRSNREIKDNEFSPQKRRADPHLIGLVDVLQSDFKKDGLSPKGNEMYKRLRAYRFDDVKGEITPTLHNARNKPEAREYLIKVVNFMKKNKLKDIDSLSKFIHARMKR